jgi:plasmid maintenance system antidote protein VapI
MAGPRESGNPGRGARGGAAAPLAAAARQVLRERGLSLRAAAALTGLNHVTIRNMARGVPARPETVLRFARGLGLPPAEWLALAGHAALVEDRPAVPARQTAGGESGYERLVRGLAELCAELGRPVPVSLSRELAAGLTVEQADATLDVLRNEARHGRF